MSCYNITQLLVEAYVSHVHFSPIEPLNYMDRTVLPNIQNDIIQMFLQKVIYQTLQIRSLNLRYK
jgi:hypothetical protein